MAGPVRERLRRLGAAKPAAVSAHVRGIWPARQALLHINQADRQLAGATAELAAEELRQAQMVLSSITGPLDADALLGRIFAGFCIGK